MDRCMHVLQISDFEIEDSTPASNLGYRAPQYKFAKSAKLFIGTP